MSSAVNDLNSVGGASSMVIDIGGSRLRQSLLRMLRTRMLAPNKQCVLPPALLSDDDGLVLWQKINRLPTYYQTEEEIDMFSLYGSEIVQKIHPHSVLIDLGCGDIRKVRPLLDKLELAKHSIQYYGLDLSRTALEESLATISTRYKFVTCRGLWGTFDDGLEWAQTIPQGPKWFLSLGSMLGNDFFEPAVAHLRKWASIMTQEDRMLLAMDATTDRAKIWNSYNDADGLFERFMRGGLAHSNRILGHQWYQSEDWEVIPTWTDDPPMHRFVFRAKKDVSCQPIGLHFSEGHEIDCYEAFKLGPDSMRQQFAAAGLREEAVWNALGSSVCGYPPPYHAALRVLLKLDTDDYLLYKA